MTDDLACSLDRARRRLEWSAVALSAAAGELEVARQQGVDVSGREVMTHAEGIAMPLSPMAAAMRSVGSERKVRDRL